MDKLILRKQKHRGAAYKVCKIDAESHELISRISQESGLSMAHVLGDIIDFAVSRLEIKED